MNRPIVAFECIVSSDSLLNRGLNKQPVGCKASMQTAASCLFKGPIQIFQFLLNITGKLGRFN